MNNAARTQAHQTHTHIHIRTHTQCRWRPELEATIEFCSLLPTTWLALAISLALCLPLSRSHLYLARSPSLSNVAFLCRCLWCVPFAVGPSAPAPMQLRNLWNYKSKVTLATIFVTHTRTNTRTRTHTRRHTHTCSMHITEIASKISMAPRAEILNAKLRHSNRWWWCCCFLS